MTEVDLTLRLHALRSIVAELGQLALRYFHDQASLGITMKGAQDWLTEADGAVEQLFRQRIAATFPSDVVMGEEQGGASGDALWIIDPIDGTANFAHNDRQWCVSVGFLHKGQPELGVIFAPALDEWFEARRGHGATLNGKPIRASSVSDMKQATLELGWSNRRPLDFYIESVRACMEAGASVKRSASGALGIVHVAMGRTDGYAEAHINSWDVAAGVVIAAEAGCHVNDFFVSDAIARGNPILVVTPGIARQLTQTLKFPGI